MAKNGIIKRRRIATAWDGDRYLNPSHVPTLTAPSSLATSIASATVTVTWSIGTASAATVIERSTNEASGYYQIAIKSAGVDSHDDTLTSSGTYYYRARHLVNGFYSDYSNTDSETLAEVPPISDGDSVTVTISGAGANVPASQFQFLGGSYGPVEAAANGALFNSFMPSGWGMPGASGTRVSSERALNGGKSLLHDTALGSQFGFNYNTGGIRRVGFARYHLYFDNPSNLTTGQLKQVRFVGGTSSSQSIVDSSYANAYITRFSGEYIPRNESPTLSTLYPGPSGGGWHQSNEWVTVEARVTDCSAAGVADGSIRVVAIRESTGEIIGTTSHENIVLRNASAALIRFIVFQFYLGNGFGGGNCRAFIDKDVACAYSDTTTAPKYIVLGNAATYSDCTVRTYCEWTAWVDNGATSDVTIKVNKGRHSSLSGLYVYAMSDAGTVINSTGVALP